MAQSKVTDGYVTKVQQHKTDAVDALKTMFDDASDVILTDYRGLNVAQITELRNKLRETGASYRVIKNRFAKIALDQLDYSEATSFLIGPTAAALATEESGPAAKVLVDFTSTSPLKIKGGIIGGTVFDERQVTEFSKLPTKPELISKLMSAMNGSLMNLMYALQGVPQKLVRTLQAVADSKGGAE